MASVELEQRALLRVNTDLNFYLCRGSDGTGSPRHGSLPEVIGGVITIVGADTVGSAVLVAGRSLVLRARS